MPTNPYESYRKLAEGLNPNRSYVFIDIDALRRTHGSEAGFRDAVAKSIRDQLGAKATDALVNDFLDAATFMKNNKFDGDAKIFSQNGHETAMVYWAWPADTTRNSFIRMFSGYSPDARLNIRPDFAPDLERLKQEVIIHEIGHATSPERNAHNTAVRYETGVHGLYANHRSELRAEIVGAMEMMRSEGSAKTAQAFNEMRAMTLFLHGDQDTNDPDRLYPQMEYNFCVQVQKVIDEAKRSGNFNFGDAEIAKTADRIMWEEDARVHEGDKAERTGGLLKQEGERFKRLDDALRNVPENQKLETAIERGLLKPGDDLTKLLIAANQHTTGQRIGASPGSPDLGGDFGGVAPPPAMPNPQGHAIANLVLLNNAFGIDFHWDKGGPYEATLQLGATRGANGRTMAENLIDAIQRNENFCDKLLSDHFKIDPQSGVLTVMDFDKISQGELNGLQKNAQIIQTLLNSGLDAAMKMGRPKGLAPAA